MKILRCILLILIYLGVWAFVSFRCVPATSDDVLAWRFFVSLIFICCSPLAYAFYKMLES